MSGRRMRGWRVRAYYGPDARSPKRPGELAIEVEHGSESGAEMEVRAARKRPDIGRVEMVEFNHWRDAPKI